MRNGTGKILMILDKPFLGDTRVRKEAFKLADQGYQIRVISLNRDERIGRNVVRGIPIYVMPLVEIFKKSTRRTSPLAVMLNRVTSSLGYVVEYLYFASVCWLLIPFVAVRDGFDVIHVHNPPNILCLLSLGYRLLGKKVVFDHHDLEPELYLSRFKIRKNMLYRILLRIEAISIRYANMVIATNQSYRAIEIERGRISPEKIFVVRNGPDIEEVPEERKAKHGPASGPARLLYVGVMGPQDGVDYLLRSLHYLRYGLGRNDFHCIVIGAGDALSDMRAYSAELELQEEVEFTGFISRSELLRYLSDADICLDPNPSSPLNDRSTWVKVMEYMAFGKPTVSFDLAETRYTAQDAALYVPPNDIKAYARGVAMLMDDPTLRRKMGQNGAARVASDLEWKIVSKNLVRAYEWLSVGGGPLKPAPRSRMLRKILRRLYYSLKPLLPRPVQIAARRRVVLQRSRGVAQSWPINRSAGGKPNGWHGWPQGRKFAFVVTHDVEGTRGVGRGQRLVRLEKEMAFVSSFNFVPEKYGCPNELCTELRNGGFEVGVHDLKHNGCLFRSERDFRVGVKAVNRYLKDWGAVGFRSGSMYHNLEWLHQMNIEYDASTFDTDPFEPQPDGVGTIFPFWVKDLCGEGGYVELPYTLPQDMTMFVLLRQADTRIWREKLDWIAEEGGMVLLVTHPDYMCWPGERRRVDEYPVELYRDFLEHVKDKYEDQYWNVLPRDLARYWKSTMGGTDGR
jgi:glycosyltransferase involved in cell wall biosynthesis